MILDYHHLPICAIMLLFFGAFFITTFGTRGGVRKIASMIASALSLACLIALIKPVMIDGEIISYWLGNRSIARRLRDRHRDRGRRAEPVLRAARRYRGLCRLPLQPGLHNPRRASGAVLHAAAYDIRRRSRHGADGRYLQYVYHGGDTHHRRGRPDGVPQQERGRS